MEKILCWKKEFGFDKGRNERKDGEEWNPQTALQPDLQKDQQDFFQVSEQLTVRSGGPLILSPSIPGPGLNRKKLHRRFTNLGPL